VEIGTHKEKRMFVQIFPTQSTAFNHIVKMLQQSAISTTHIENSFGLLVQRTVKNFDDKFIQNFKISRMRTATSPNIHFAVYMDFLLTHFHFTNFIGTAK